MAREVTNGLMEAITQGTGRRGCGMALADTYGPAEPPIKANGVKV